MKNKERRDTYDKDLNKIGENYRGDKLKEGEFNLGVQAIIINSKNEILISKRSSSKERYPSMWECNGGAVKAGEDGITGIKREILEELGIELDSNGAICLKTVIKNKENRIKILYLFNLDLEIEDIKYNDGEAEETRWVDIDKFTEMYKNNEIVPNVDFDKADYEKCLALIKQRERNSGSEQSRKVSVNDIGEMVRESNLNKDEIEGAKNVGGKYINNENERYI